MNIKTKGKLLVADRTLQPENWSKLREKTIGSSEVVSIMGLNPYQTALDLWALKTKRKKTEDNPAMKYGRAVEPIIIELFADKNPELHVSNSEALYQHAELPWCVCTPDALVSYDGENFDGILEIKHSAVYKDWENGSTPDYAHCQVIWQMGVMGMRYAYIAAVVGGRANDLQVRFVEFDEKIFKLMLEKAAVFLEHVNKDVPPQAQAADSKLIDEITKREAGKIISLETSAEAEKWLLQYDAAAELLKEKTAEIKSLEAKKKEAEANLKMLLQDAEAGQLADGRWVKVKTVNMPAKEVKAYSYTRFNITKKGI